MKGKGDEQGTGMKSALAADGVGTGLSACVTPDGRDEQHGGDWTVAGGMGLSIGRKTDVDRHYGDGPY